MKIIVDEAIPYIRGRFPEDAEVEYLPGGEISRENVTDADALIIRTRTKCNAGLLEGSGVKLIATATIGTDHIDEDWCRQAGIIVRNAPGCNAPGVAQYLFSSLLRMGFNPDRETLGIIGYGNVGHIVASWAKEMDIKTLISDLPRQDAGFKDAPYLSQEEVLEKSDAVTLHVPFTTEGPYSTRHLIGRKEMEMMKNGAILVNTSRGGVVDEKGWKEFIREGKLKGVVDVWENEPAIDSELLKLTGIATPHIAGYSLEGKKRATSMALSALKNELGVEVDLSGLECEPLPDGIISKESILKSYNPENDSKALKESLQNFEQLRNKYEYRHEPLYV